MSEPRGGIGRLPFGLFAVASFVLHAAVFAVSVLFGWRGGPPGAGGERGRAGAGDLVVEIAVLAARSSAVLPPTPLVDAARTGPEPTTASREEVPRARRVLTAPERAEPASSAPTGASLAATPMPTDEDAASMRAQASAAPAASSSGSPSEGASHSGRAPGSDAVGALILGSVGVGSAEGASRALLERALRCDDPITGTWVAHRYSPEFHDWARMTMMIRRDGERLTGHILSRAWSGQASDRRPPACTPGGHDVTVLMEAHGRLRGTDFVFGADTHSIARVDCPSSLFSYNPDTFRGQLEPAGECLDTLNNDGGRDVDAPYRFRRTACAPRGATE